MVRAFSGVEEGRRLIQRSGGSEGDIVEALLCWGWWERERLWLKSSASVPGGWSHELGSLAGGRRCEGGGREWLARFKVRCWSLFSWVVKGTKQARTNHFGCHLWQML